MIYYRLGEVIRELRSRLHMTQEELAAGICSVSTIAKIESGSQMPSGRVAEALFRRLKDAGCFFTGFAQTKELEELCSWERTLERAKGKRVGSSLFEEQFYAYVRIQDRMRQTTDHAVILLELMEVLVMSMPLGELYDETAQRRTYTYLELYVLNSIAVQFYYMGSYDHAMRILERLHGYLQEWHRYGEVGSDLYPVVCNNLAVVKLMQGHVRPARILCDDGINKCLDTGRLSPLLELYGNLSNILSALKEPGGAQQAYARMRVLSEMIAERECSTLSARQEVLRQNYLKAYVNL